LSFTLALSLPASGGGLSWWELDEAAVLNMSGEELKRRVQEQPPRFHPYQVGSLALHSGHTLHQVAPSKTMLKGESRITLQGHALLGTDGAYHYYW
jgi:hypothetical protein